MKLTRIISIALCVTLLFSFTAFASSASGVSGGGNSASTGSSSGGGGVSTPRPIIKAESKAALPGESVDIVLTVKNNPGIAVLGFDIGYDRGAMTLTAVTVNDIFDDGDVTAGNMNKNPYTFSAMNVQGNVTASGSLVTLTFLIKEACPDGSYPIRLTNPESYKIDESVVNFATEDGAVTVDGSSLEEDTTDYEYTIDSLKLINPSTREEVSSIPSSEFIAEATVSNDASDDADYLIIAAYDAEGSIVSVTYMYYSIEIGKSGKLGTLIKNPNGAIAKVKAFVWSPEKIKPLAKALQIGK